jgi:hypothetical protein
MASATISLRLALSQFSRVSTSCARDKAKRRASMAERASSLVWALRRVCEAIDWTVARVFFTLWFNSLMRSC